MINLLVPSQCPAHEQVVVGVAVETVLLVVVVAFVVVVERVVEVVEVVEVLEDKSPRLLARAETNESPISRKVLKLVI